MFLFQWNIAKHLVFRRLFRNIYLADYLFIKSLLIIFTMVTPDVRVHKWQLCDTVSWWIINPARLKRICFPVSKRKWNVTVPYLDAARYFVLKMEQISEWRGQTVDRWKAGRWRQIDSICRLRVFLWSCECIKHPSSLTSVCLPSDAL